MGLINKCHDSIWKGCATEFEGLVIKTLTMPVSLTKRSMLQGYLQQLTADGVPDILVLDQLLAYAKENSSGTSATLKKPKSGASASAKSEALPLQDAASGASVAASSSKAGPARGASSAASSASAAALPRSR